jgi:hypothetical protein
MMIIGIGLLGTFTSYLASKFLEHEQESAQLRATLADVAASLSPSPIESSQIPKSASTRPSLIALTSAT